MTTTVEAGHGLNEAFKAMQVIHRIFGTPAPDSPVALTPYYRQRRIDWIKSELDELDEAGDSLVDQVDAFLDVIVFAIGGLVETGVMPGRLYEYVLDSQHAKLWEDGLPRVREEDGKWIKPPNWEAPEPKMQKEIEKQCASK